LLDRAGLSEPGHVGLPPQEPTSGLQKTPVIDA
jgi:hypothetical protein